MHQRNSIEATGARGHSASFRDPAGFVFTRDGVLYRQINETAGTDYERLLSSGLYKDLAGSGDMVPTLGARGPFRVGKGCELRLSGAIGHTVSLLAVGLQESAIANFPYSGITSYCQPWSFLFVLPVSGPPGVAGAGGFRIPYLVPPEAQGFSFFHQVFVADPGAAHGLSATQGLELDYGGP